MPAPSPESAAPETAEAGISSDPPSPPAARAFVRHAQLISVITFLSRLVGLAREMIAARYFGDTGVLAAWKVAFTVPNLFRKLLGEGALSSAFVPLYAQAVKRHEDRAGERSAVGRAFRPAEETSTGGERRGGSEGPPYEGGEVNTGHQGPPHLEYESSAPADSPSEFAVASVNLLAALLVAITIVGEIVVLALMRFDWSPNNALVLKFSVIMLPYVTLVCLTAFLGGILQVHGRFTAVTFTSVVLNLCLIAIIVAVARAFDLNIRAEQTRAAVWLSYGVLVSGGIQLVMLFPSLQRAGFRFRLMTRVWTPAVKKMFVLTLPLALSAGVLQIGVMLDKGIAQFLAQSPGYDTMHVAGQVISRPIREGAAYRLDLAQFMYQFPLGVFAIALATAIFPTLGREAIEPRGEPFKRALREGIEASLWIGLPASAGMILVAEPAIRLLFQGPKFSAESAGLTALSTAIYSGAIWAFSLLQIINRGFYSIHDSRTPLVWMMVNLTLNLVIEIPLLWTPLHESAMAVGTLVSFTVQAVAMLWQLDRRLGGIGIGKTLTTIGKMLVATAVMFVVCWGATRVPGYPHAMSKLSWAVQMVAIIAVGGAVYVGVCAVLGVTTMRDFMPRRRRTI